MANRWIWVWCGAAAALLGATACEREAPAAPAAAATADVDALWAMAPAGTKLGIVAAPRAVVMADHAAADILSYMRAAPELAAIATMMEASAKQQGLPSLSFAAAGLGNAGFATFGLDHDKTLIVLPVVDAAKFVAVAGGTHTAAGDTIQKLHCRSLAKRYVCATDDALFATIGKGDLRATRALIPTRGDIEVAGELEGTKFGISLQLARGELAVRGTVKGIPLEPSKMFTKPATMHVDPSSSAFAIFDLSFVAPMLKNAPQAPLAPGVTFRDVERALVGPLTASMHAGTNAIDTRIALADPAPVKTVLAHCPELTALVNVQSTYANGRCHFVLAPALFDTTLWVEGSTLRITTAPSGASTDVPLTPVGAEIANGSWSLASWGRGTMLGIDWSPMTKAIPAGQTALVMRALSMLDEFGFAMRFEHDTVKFVANVRTAWANPDAVVGKLAALDINAVSTGHGAEIARKLAGEVKGTPLADDLRAGPGGMMFAMMPVGLLSAVAIPAFLDYMKKSKESSASLTLDMIGKNAKRVYAETGKFPIGKSATLPVGGGLSYANNCCGVGTDNKCVPDPKAFAHDKLWSALDVSLDEPTTYQYRYEGTAKEFTATASGDGDCDGTSAVWTLHGTVDATGNVVTDLQKPAPGVY